MSTADIDYEPRWGYSIYNLLENRGLRAWHSNLHMIRLLYIYPIRAKKLKYAFEELSRSDRKRLYSDLIHYHSTAQSVYRMFDAD